jgi:hypothetical protein
MSSVISSLEVLANTVRSIVKYSAKKGNALLNVSCSYSVPVYCCFRVRKYGREIRRKYPDSTVSCKAKTKKKVKLSRNEP